LPRSTSFSETPSPQHLERARLDGKHPRLVHAVELAIDDPTLTPSACS
jgi:hypothetical protein